MSKKIPIILDNNAPRNVRVLLLVFSGILAYSLDQPTQQLISAFLESQNVPTEFVNSFVPFSISFLAYYGLLWALFDNVLWKFPIINSLIGVPNLNGVWDGVFHRKDFAGDKTESDIPAQFIIAQTFTRMSLRFWSRRPKKGKVPSDATLIGLSVDNSHAVTISYIFHFGEGKGFGEITLTEDRESGRKALSGEYVSTVPRKGDIYVEKCLVKTSELSPSDFEEQK